MNRQQQLRAWLRALVLHERQLLGKVARERYAYLKAAAKSYEDHGQPPAHLNAAHVARLESLLAAQYAAVVPAFGALALAQVKRRRVELKAGLVSALTAEWIRRQALEKAKLIAETDRDDVLAAIAGGMEEGEGIAEIARRIRQVSQLTPYRAAVVARTETHAAATYGSIQSVRDSAEELGMTLRKEWLATKDSRTRPDHLAADGQTVGLDEKFTVGGVAMDRPGDPSAPPSQTVACRCALTYVEAE